MARKRITESDLLDYRAKADELYQELEEKYDAIDKAKKPADELEEKETGLLIIRHKDVELDAIRRFAIDAKIAGFAVEVVDLAQEIVENKLAKRVPAWEKNMDKAQLGYVKICERARQIVVLGTGDAAPTATVIAEQYPVDALIIVGEGPAMKPFNANRTVSKLAGVARRNLFSIVCPVYCITPEINPGFRQGSAKLYHDCTRSDDVKLESVSEVSVSNIWTEREQMLENSIFEYLKQI